MGEKTNEEKIQKIEVKTINKWLEMSRMGYSIKTIKASSRECVWLMFKNKQKCRKKGYRWITADPDIIPFVLCRWHATKFQMDILNESLGLSKNGRLLKIKTRQAGRGKGNRRDKMA